jgi:hypothetical protein
VQACPCPAFVDGSAEHAVEPVAIDEEPLAERGVPLDEFAATGQETVEFIECPAKVVFGAPGRNGVVQLFGLGVERLPMSVARGTRAEGWSSRR